MKLEPGAKLEIKFDGVSGPTQKGKMREIERVGLVENQHEGPYDKKT